MADEHEQVSDVVDVLARAREAVAENRRRRRAQGHDANEELLTDWLCDAAWPRIEYAQFNRQEEGVVGADWLWWFVDGSGECFGTLVQAKKLRGAVGSWSLDLAYPRGTREQMGRLFATAEHFDVPAAYVLYLGDYDERPDLECSEHTPPECNRCVRSSISVLPALAAETAVTWAYPYHPEELVPDAVRFSMPLEDMVVPATDKVFDLNLRAANVDVQRFLVDRQDGARAVAKHFFQIISEIRRGQFSAATTVERARGAADHVFEEVPVDGGHSGRPYFPHVLRGLRRTLPDYVVQLVLDRQAEPPPDGLGGIVVVHL